MSGYNLYSYCLNNPINFEDSKGTVPQSCGPMKLASYYEQKQQITILGKTLTKPKESITFVGKLISDFKNYDKNNTDERKVLEAYYFSSYKEKFVVRLRIGRSGSLGILFIDQNEDHVDIVRHEYGHTKQLDQLGLWKYLLFIGIPSVYNDATGDAYYEKPYEVVADIEGGVQSRDPAEVYVKAGYDYIGGIRNMRKCFIAAILIGISVLFTSCYSSREKEYYSDRTVFVEDTGTIECIYDHRSTTGAIIIVIKCDNEDFSGNIYGTADFCLEGENLKILLKNGLMDKMSIGKEVKYVSAPRYFGDGYDFPIVALTIEEEELLSFDEGYKNLLDTYRYVF